MTTNYSWLNGECTLYKLNKASSWRWWTISVFNGERVDNITLYHPIIMNGMRYVAHLMTFWKITFHIYHFFKLNFFETLKVKCEHQNVIGTSIPLKPKLNKWLSSSKNIKIICQKPLSVLKRKFWIGILVFETEVANITH